MSIKVKGKMKGQSRSVTIKADNTNDGKTATVSMEFTMTEKQAQRRFGEDYAHAAFSDYTGEGDMADSVVTRKTFSPELQVKTEHLMEFQNGGDEVYPLVCKPQLGDVFVNAGRRITVPVKIPIPSTAEKLIALVARTVGDQLTVEFKGEHQTEMFEAKKAQGPA